MTLGLHLLLHAVGHVASHSRRQRQQTVAYSYPNGFAHPMSNVAYNNFPESDVGYNVAKSRRTGYGQIICGVLSVMIGIAAIVVPEHTYLSIVISIWSAVTFFIVAGILGITSAVYQTKRLIVGHLVMSILASVAAFQMMCLMTVGALKLEYGDIDGFLVCGFGGTVALIEFIIAIIAATICCRGIRKPDDVAAQQTVSQMPHPIANQSYPTVITNPQTMVAHPGYIHQPLGYPLHAYNNQGFNVPQQAFQGVPSMPPPGAPPAELPPSYEYGNAGGVPMPQA